MFPALGFGAKLPPDWKVCVTAAVVYVWVCVRLHRYETHDDFRHNDVFERERRGGVVLCKLTNKVSHTHTHR